MDKTPSLTCTCLFFSCSNRNVRSVQPEAVCPREDGGRTAKWLEVWLAFHGRRWLHLLETTNPLWYLSGIVSGEWASPGLGESSVTFTWPRAASSASPPFPRQLYISGSSQHLHFPKWHLPIASRFVDVLSSCIFTWKPLSDSLGLGLSFCALCVQYYL